MKTIRFAVMMASVGLTFTLVGCDSKPAETEQAAAKPAHVSENDQYLQRMQQEVKIDDPDSLIAMTIMPKKRNSSLLKA